MLNLAILQLLQVAQDHRFSQFRRKPRQRRLYLAAQLSQQGLLIRPPSRGFLVFHHRHLVIQRIRYAISLRPTVMVNQQIARHARHPGCESAMGRTIAAQSPVHSQEDILRQILGLRPVSREPVADVKNAPAVATHKFLPGRPVALEALLDQLGILLQRIFSLMTCYGARRVCEPALSQKTVWQSISACQLWNVKCSRNVPRGTLSPATDHSVPHLTQHSLKTQEIQSISELVSGNPDLKRLRDRPFGERTVG